MGFLVLFSATLLLAHRVQACTVVELDSSGFAENAYSLLHALPMFFNRNGTFYLDNSEFRYKCSEHGGWHDFFSGEENIVPWSQQKETMQGKECARYARHEVDELLHTVLQTKPDLLDFVGMKKAWRYRPWVQDYVDQQLSAMASHGRPTIGFYIRGGKLARPDKSRSRAQASPVETVQSFAHTYSSVRGGTCIMVGAEQQLAEAAKAAERHLQCKVLLPKPYQRRADDSQATDNEKAEDFDMRCSGTVQMLIEMELLTHADYLVASDRTKWSKILQYMRYILYGTPSTSPNLTGKDKSTFLHGGRIQKGLYSAIRKYTSPSAMPTSESGGTEGAEQLQSAKARRPRKKPRKGKRKAPRKAPPPPPPPAPDQGAKEDEKSDYEGAPWSDDHDHTS